MKLPQKLSATLLGITLLGGVVPTAANAAETAIYMNPNAGITKLWKTDPAKFGQPLTKENCVKGKGCEQLFENAVITWNARNGVKALTGTEKAQAFLKAGGVAAFGALEGDAWNNTYCGPVVTAGDGKARYLVVVEDAGKGQLGASLNLNSTPADQWKKERYATKLCFDQEAPVTPPPSQPSEPTHPATELDWSQAIYSPFYQAIFLPDTDGVTFYKKEANSDGTVVAGAEIREWSLDAPPAKNLFEDQEEALGWPIAPATWNGETGTQEFVGGTLTWTRGNPHPTVKLNLKGATWVTQNMHHSGAQFLGSYGVREWTQLSDRYYEGKGTFFVYDAKTGKVVVMDQRILDAVVAEPDRWGDPVSSYIYLTREEEVETGTTFQKDETHRYTLVGQLTKSLRVSPSVLETDQNGTIHWVNEASYDVDKEPALDLQATNWDSEATYHAGIGVKTKMVETLSGPLLLIVQANSDGTPVAGATTYASRWLGYNDYGLYNHDEDIWAGGPEEYASYPQAYLGLPTAQSQVIEENGVKYEVQQFEHGTAKWKIEPRPWSHDLSGNANAKITLDPQTQARFDAAQ